jgi:hypothetical protein
VQAPRNAVSRSAPAEAAESGSVAHDNVDVTDDDMPVESVVDQIAKTFPGARIVDSTKN